MGIRGLTTSARRKAQSVPTKTLSESDVLVYIDGPALSHVLDEKHPSSLRLSRDYAQTTIRRILELTRNCAVVRIYFDAAMTAEKEPVRMERRVQRIHDKKKSRFSAMLLQQTLVLDFPDLGFVMVHGEAEDQIAHDIAREHRGRPTYILSNDSDFYRFDYGSTNVFLARLDDFLVENATTFKRINIESVRTSLVRSSYYLPIPPDQAIVKPTCNVSCLDFVNTYSVFGEFRNLLATLQQSTVAKPAFRKGLAYRKYAYRQLMDGFSPEASKETTVFEYYQDGSGYTRHSVTVAKDLLGTDKYEALKKRLSTVDGVVAEIADNMDEYGAEVQLAIKKYFGRVLTSTDLELQLSQLDLARTSVYSNPDRLREFVNELQVVVYSLFYLQLAGCAMGVELRLWYADEQDMQAEFRSLFK